MFRANETVVRKMLRVFVIVGLIVVVNFGSGVIDCAPSGDHVNETQDTQVDAVRTEPEVPDEVVKYDGAQLWNIPFRDEATRNTIINLQNEFG